MLESAEIKSMEFFKLEDGVTMKIHAEVGILEDKTRLLLKVR